MNPFRDWTPAQVAAHNARLRGGIVTVPAHAAERESDLHEAIFDECRRRGWLVLHGAMSERTHRTLGEEDFVIRANHGRVFWIEAKSKNGKLTPFQLALHAHATVLGHKTHVVRSIEEFRMIVDGHAPQTYPHPRD